MVGNVDGKREVVVMTEIVMMMSLKQECRRRKENPRAGDDPVFKQLVVHRITDVLQPTLCDPVETHIDPVTLKLDIASVLRVVYHLMNMRSDRRTYLLPFLTIDPSCNKQSWPCL